MQGFAKRRGAALSAKGAKDAWMVEHERLRDAEVAAERELQAALAGLASRARTPTLPLVGAVAAAAHEASNADASAQDASAAQGSLACASAEYAQQGAELDALARRVFGCVQGARDAASAMFEEATTCGDAPNAAGLSPPGTAGYSRPGTTARSRPGTTARSRPGTTTSRPGTGRSAARVRRSGRMIQDDIDAVQRQMEELREELDAEVDYLQGEAEALTAEVRRAWPAEAMQGATAGGAGGQAGGQPAAQRGQSGAAALAEALAARHPLAPPQLRAEAERGLDALDTRHRARIAKAEGAVQQLRAVMPAWTATERSVFARTRAGGAARGAASVTAVLDELCGMLPRHGREDIVAFDAWHSRMRAAERALGAATEAYAREHGSAVVAWDKRLGGGERAAAERSLRLARAVQVSAAAEDSRARLLAGRAQHALKTAAGARRAEERALRELSAQQAADEQERRERSAREAKAARRRREVEAARSEAAEQAARCAAEEAATRAEEAVYNAERVEARHREYLDREERSGRRAREARRELAVQQRDARLDAIRSAIEVKAERDAARVLRSTKASAAERGSTMGEDVAALTSAGHGFTTDQIIKCVTLKTIHAPLCSSEMHCCLQTGISFIQRLTPNLNHQRPALPRARGVARASARHGRRRRAAARAGVCGARHALGQACPSAARRHLLVSAADEQGAA